MRGCYIGAGPLNHLSSRKDWLSGRWRGVVTIGADPADSVLLAKLQEPTALARDCFEKHRETIETALVLSAGSVIVKSV
jgi:hypothetical protein